MRPIAGQALWRSSILTMVVCAALLGAYAWPTGAVLTLGETPTLALISGSLLVVLAVALIGGERARGSGRYDPGGLLLAGLAACLWAGSGLLLGQALKVVDATAANMVRFPLAAILFTLSVTMLRHTENLTGHLVWLSLLAAIGTLASASLFLAGLEGAGVARGVALNATSPVFSAILAAAVLRERVSRRTTLGITCSVLGTILLVT